MGSTPADLKRDPEYDHRQDELAELRALLLGQQIVELQELRRASTIPTSAPKRSASSWAKRSRSPCGGTAACNARSIPSLSRP